MNSPDFWLTNRDEAFLLLGELDLEAQLLAVRSLLRRNAQADAQLAQEIDALAKRAEEASGDYGLHLTNHWVDQLHGSVFQDAANSMAAIGMLAPMLESLFVAVFAGVRDLQPPANPVSPNGPRAAHLADAKFWDPHYVFGAEKRRKDIVPGICQLAESIGLAAHFPADYARVLDALIKYRNKMFHNGFEWPNRERANFDALIEQQGWPTEWFERSLSNNETWIVYMSEVLIQLALTRLDEMLEGIGVFIRAQYPAD